MKIVKGKMVTEYDSLLDGGEIEMSVFVTSEEEILKAGYESIDRFLDYIEEYSDWDEPAAFDTERSRELSFEDFTLVDYIRIGGCRYLLSLL